MRALNFNTVSQSLSNMVYYKGGHRAARAAKKGGSIFVPKKRPYPGGGGARGGLAKDHTFPNFFSEPFPIKNALKVRAAAI